MYSLGEIETQCRKAARGVGLSWGLANEVGLVARHLMECNLPGPEAVLRSLKWIDAKGCDYKIEGVLSIEKINSPTNGLFLGLFFLDRVRDVIGKEICISQKIVGPLALVGFLLRLKKEKYWFLVEWSDCMIKLEKDGLMVSGKNLNPKFVQNITIKIFIGEVQPASLGLPKTRLPVQHWDVLTEMANRTNVPATEKSRLLGAGAGLNENE
jgi:hypothetical protein